MEKAGKPETIETDKSITTRQFYETWILDFNFYGDINELELSVERDDYTYKISRDYCSIFDKKNGDKIHEDIFNRMTKIVEDKKDVEYPVGKVANLHDSSWQKKEKSVRDKFKESLHKALITDENDRRVTCSGCGNRVYVLFGNELHCGICGAVTDVETGKQKLGGLL